MRINEQANLDISVFEKVTISMNGAELKALLAEWFSEIALTFQEALKNKEKEEKYLTAGETAKIIGVDKSTLWRWNKCKYLESVRIGGKVRYRLSDIEELLNKKG